MKRYSHRVAQLLNPALMVISRKYPDVHVALEMRYEHFVVIRDQVVSLGGKTKM